MIARALRFAFSRKGLAVASIARRAKRAGEDWYPVRVTGISMVPTLRPGDLLAVRFPQGREPRVGQVVVASTDRRELVKRVVAVPGERFRDGVLGEDEFWLEGDNTRSSTDSRAIGPVHRRDIMGVVRMRYWPPQRARLF